MLLPEYCLLYCLSRGTPLLCLDRQSRPWALLCRDLLKGMGVPWGEMKGVLDSEAEPKVAALEMSLPLPLGCCCRPPLLPGRRWRGRAEPELCLERSMLCTGVERGEMKGEAGGDWAEVGWRGEIGWNEK